MAGAALPPLWITPGPVLRPEDEPPRRQHRRANPSAAGVVYPCGAIPEAAGRWLVSYGLHDERCCLRRIRLDAVQAQLFAADVQGRLALHRG
jgi:predicted GH43/DUF377 family glycosyl hydrolase